MNELPFKEIRISNDIRIRKFMQSSKDDEFVWHRDEEDRTIACRYPTNWMIQLEDGLPKKIGEDPIFIPAKTWHRLIKGTGDLEVQIGINNKDEESIHI